MEHTNDSKLPELVRLAQSGYVKTLDEQLELLDLQELTNYIEVLDYLRMRLSERLRSSLDFPT